LEKLATHYNEIDLFIQNFPKGF